MEVPAKALKIKEFAAIERFEDEIQIKEEKDPDEAPAWDAQTQNCEWTPIKNEVVDDIKEEPQPFDMEACEEPRPFPEEVKIKNEPFEYAEQTESVHEPQCELEIKPETLHYGREIPSTYQMVFKCLQCIFKTKTECFFRNHLWHHHFTCCYCLYKCTEDDNLVEHLRDRHGPPFTLPVVHLAQIQYERMIQPDKEMVDVGWVHKEPKYQCQECDFRANSRMAVRRHVNVKHCPPVPPKFKCTDCEFRSKTRNAVKNHVTHKHPAPEQDNYFKCHRIGSTGVGPINFDCVIPNCPYHTTDVTLMERHLLKNHVASKVQTYNCDSCPFKTSNRSTFRRHQLEHNPPEELDDAYHRCEFCGFRAAQKIGVRNHVKAKHWDELDESD